MSSLRRQNEQGELKMSSTRVATSSPSGDNGDRITRTVTNGGSLSKPRSMMSLTVSPMPMQDSRPSGESADPSAPNNGTATNGGSLSVVGPCFPLSLKISGPICRNCQKGGLLDVSRQGGTFASSKYRRRWGYAVSSKPLRNRHSWLSLISNH